MDKHEEKLPDRVELTDMLNKIDKTEYVKLSDGKTTLCVVVLKNGYTLLGKSACVNPANFNQALGEKYAFEDAIDQMWPLEGYLLSQRIYEERAK